MRVSGGPCTLIHMLARFCSRHVWYLFLALFPTVLAGVKAPLALPESWPHEGSDLPADPKVTWGQLKNGLRYAILPHDEPPERISLRLYVGAGSLMESGEQQGLAHFLEHMAFNGTENFPAGEMVEYFQRLGMAFGADTNAHTSFDETVYKLELPNASEEVLRDSLLLLRDYADRMVIAPEEVDRERGVILAEMVQRDSPEYRSFVEELKFLLPGSLVSERLPIGQREILESATAEVLRDYYETWYDPQRMFLVATGNVTAETLEPLFAEYFEGLEPGELPPLPVPVAAIESAFATAVHHEPEAKAVTVSMTSLEPVDRGPDSREKRVQELFRDAAHAILNRRFERYAQEEEAPFTRAFAVTYPWLNSVRTSSLVITTSPQQWNSALALAEQELRRAREHGFTEAEVEEVRARFRLVYEQAAQTASTRKAPGLANGLVQSFARGMVFTHPEDVYEILLPVIEEMSAEDLHEGIRRNWPRGPDRVFVAGNLPGEVDQEVALAAFQTSQEVAVEALETEEEKRFAYTDFGDSAEVLAQHTHEDLGITQVMFVHGVRLNLKPTDFEANTIRVLVRVGGGELSIPEGRPELAFVAGQTFVAGGLEEHSFDELRRILAGTSAGVSFGVAADAFELAGSTTPEDLELQLQLMAAYLSEPAFRPESLRLMQRELDEFYRGVNQTLRGTMRDEVARFLANGDGRFGVPDREQVEAVTLNEVREWLVPQLRDGYLEISIVGDFEVEETIELVAKTLGALPERTINKPSFSQARQVHFPAGQEERFTYPSRLPQALAGMYWPTDDIWDISQTRRLLVLASILDDRLRIKVREELGEAYSPSAYAIASDTYPDYGYLAALIPTEAGGAEALLPVLEEIAESVVLEGISKDEFERAMAPQLERLKLIRRDNGYWLHNVLGRAQEYPHRLDWARTIEEDIASITRDEIETLAVRYLDGASAARVLIVPEDLGDESTE